MLRLIFYVFIISFSMWFGGFLWFAETSRNINETPDHRADLIVVLTGGEQRIDHGLKLFEKGYAQKVFITGVAPNVRPRDLKLSDHCCVTLGHEATNTVENAQEVKRWILNNRDTKYESVLLITSDYHMLRSLVVFRHTLPELFILPHTVKSADWFSSRLAFRLHIREYNKFLAQLFMQYLGIKTIELIQTPAN